MKIARSLTGTIVAAALTAAAAVQAQDWPQWRGPNRDAKVTGFTAPSTWPKELTKKWKVKVGNGVATPALVGDRLYVFTREDGNEVIRCLDAAGGKELWSDRYEAKAATGPSGSFPGPRASPTVADGKVILLGVSGVLSCYDAAEGKKLWRKDGFGGALPSFFTSSSPIVVDGMCVAQVGSDGKGGIVAYDLATGDEKWKWTEDGAAYGSPVLLTVGDTRAIVAETSAHIVAINAADGKLLWLTPFARQGRSYNAATPMVDGQMVIYSGAPRGTHAVKVARKGNELEAKTLWENKQTAVQFNTPVIKDGHLFGLSDRNELFCIDLESGKTAWTAPAPTAGGGGGGGGGRRMGGSGFGSVVDAGTVLFALTPAAQLVVFEPSAREFKQIASYKVADSPTHAYPVIAGNRIFIKDSDSVTLWIMD